MHASLKKIPRKLAKILGCRTTRYLDTDNNQIYQKHGTIGKNPVWFDNDNYTRSEVIEALKKINNNS